MMLRRHTSAEGKVLHAWTCAWQIQSIGFEVEQVEIGPLSEFKWVYSKAKDYKHLRSLQASVHNKSYESIWNCDFLLVTLPLLLLRLERPRLNLVGTI